MSRVFKTFTEARNEIRRDLSEMGTQVLAGYQSMDLNKLDDSYTTLELQNYDYVVIHPNQKDLDHITLPWVQEEWEERLDGLYHKPVNPGNAWRLRFDVWEPLLETDGRFAYTYSERFDRAEIEDLILAFKHNENSRQVYLGIWDPVLDTPRIGTRRIPCSIGYHIMQRYNKLHMTYYMRSSDASTHWDNDCWLALEFLKWFGSRVGVEPGTFTHCISSLHVYKKDVAGVF